MNKIFYLPILLTILIFSVVIGLIFLEYFFYEEEIVNPGGNIYWQKFDNNSFIFNDTETIYNSNNYSIFTNITEKIKEIDGIENINYEIFISNNSISEIIEYYSKKLEEDGYSINNEYSGVTPYEYFELKYYTYIKGINGVVIFIKTIENLTWVCYSTGNLLEYENIINNLEI
jgi:hypothetical protein